MHGGAKGSGAPKGNQNAWKHGEYSAENKRTRKRINKIHGLLSNALDAIESGDDKSICDLLEEAHDLGWEQQNGEWRIAWTEVLSENEDSVVIQTFEQVASGAG